MAKTLGKLRTQTLKLKELEPPKDVSKRTKAFVRKHVYVVHPDANENGDDVFKATNVKRSKRSPDHGYEPGEDEDIYEGAMKDFATKMDDMESMSNHPIWDESHPNHESAKRTLKNAPDSPQKRRIVKELGRDLKSGGELQHHQSQYGITEGNSITESKALLDRASSTAEENDGGLILTHKVKSKSGLTTTRQYQHVGHDEKASHWFPLGDHDHHLDAFSSDPKKSYKKISHKELGNMMDNGAHLDVLHHHHEEDEDGNLHISSDDYKTGATMRLNANGNPTNKTKKVTRSSRTGVYNSYEPQGNKLDEILGLPAIVSALRAGKAGSSGGNDSSYRAKTAALKAKRLKGELLLKPSMQDPAQRAQMSAFNAKVDRLTQHKTDMEAAARRKAASDYWDEKLDIEKTSMGGVIKDFQQSDAPQFKGKSKLERRKMAIAAKLNSEGFEHIAAMSESDQALLVDTYNSLTEENQERFLEIAETEEGCDKLLDFCITTRGND